MSVVDLIFRVYMIQPRIKKNHKDIDIDLTLVELNDGHSSYKNQFESQDEAIYYLQNSSDIKVDREYLIIPSCRIRF